MRPLLFERLVGVGIGEDDIGSHLRMLDVDGLKASVRREVEWLLNTRCPVSVDRLEERERTTIDYGLPDFSGKYTWDSTHQRELARFIGQTISAFEPRLQDVEVTVVPLLPPRHDGFRVAIAARLVVGEVVEPLSFPVVINQLRSRAAAG